MKSTRTHTGRVSNLTDEQLRAAMREMGRRGAASRKPTERVCPVCGGTFIGVGRAVYDRPSCRSVAYQRRKRRAATDSSDAFAAMQPGAEQVQHEGR